MLPAVTRTATAVVTALALAAASVAPAQALGKNERNVLKGVAAAVIIHELVRKSRASADPTPMPVNPQPWPGYQNPGYGYQTNVAGSTFYEFSPQARRVIQQRLAAYGYYRGAIDGVWGRGTSAAVSAYARDVRATNSLTTRDGTVQLYNALIG